MSTNYIKLSGPVTGDFWEIPVLHEDEHLMALYKPPCLLTSPDRTDAAQSSLMGLLHAAIAAGKPWAAERKLTYLMNAHRLDGEASGILLLAKSKPVLVALASLFGSAKPFLTFTALVQGETRQQTWEINAPLAMQPERAGFMRVDHKLGKKSITRFQVLERFRGYLLIGCQPLTARLHQIRVHLKHSGMPIAGDTMYGGHPLMLSLIKPNYRLKPGASERPLISTLALHAEKLEIAHPVTGQPVVVRADWPRDLRVAVKYLRQCAA